MKLLPVVSCLAAIQVGCRHPGSHGENSGDGLLAALGFDGGGWRVEYPHNTVRNAAGVPFPTLEQGRWRPPRIVPRGPAEDGAIWYGVPASDAPKDRVETILARDVPVGVTRFSSFSVRFPDDLARVPEDGWFLFNQWHQSSPESPPLALELKPGTNNVLLISYRFTGDDGCQKRRLRYRDIALGQWVHFVVKWRFDPGGDGEAVVWMDGNEVFSYHGRLGFSHVDDMRMDEKFGIYRSGAPAPAEIMYDQIRLGLDRDSVTGVPRSSAVPSSAYTTRRRDGGTRN